MSEHHHEHSIPDSKEKMVALVEHLAHHNEDHLDELKALEHAIAGYSEEATEKLRASFAAYDEGNAALQEVLKALREA